MSSTPVVLRNAVDTFTWEARPSEEYPNSTRLRLRTSSGQNQFAWVYFTRPFPLGATIISARLKVYADAAAGNWGAASRTLTGKRVTAGWKVARLNYGNQPGTTTTNQATVTKSTAITDGTLWDLDIKAMMQQVADGTAWYGIRLDLNDATLRRLYSAQASRFKPTLEVTWSEAPDKPTVLSPSGNRSVSVALPVLRFDFTDTAGNTSMAAARIQIDANNIFTAPTLDTGWVAMTDPQYDLAALTTFNAPLPNGTFDANTTGWSGTSCTLASIATAPRTGPQHLSMTSTSTVDMKASTPTGVSGIRVLPSTAYTVTAFTRTAVTARSARIDIVWYDSSGATISTTTGTASANTTSYASRTASATSPAGAAYASVQLVIVTPANGEVHYWDDVTMTAVWTGMGAGTSWWWRVAVQDGAGLQSAFSDPAQMSRTAKVTLTITNPSSGSPVVQEATPPITWTVSGGTQTAYQVIITDVNGNWLADSRRRSGTANSWTIPTGVIVDGSSYIVVVKVWDAVLRENTPSDTAYVEASRTFTFTQSAGVATVAGLTAATPASGPGVQLDFTRTTAPDSFSLVRDGKVIANGILPGDVTMGGTAYRIMDRTCSANRSHTWEVRSVVGGVTSSSNPTVTTTVTQYGIWLWDDDNEVGVQLLDKDEGDWEMAEQSEVHHVLGAQAPVRIVQGLGGYEGGLSGRIVTYAGVQMATQEATLLAIKSRATRPIRLALADLNLPVTIGNILPRPSPDPEPQRIVSFRFEQVGEYPARLTL